MNSPRFEAGTDSPLIGVVGNPNTGKTTLFNALTGLHQHVGNYAGVTVERKEGRLRLSDRSHLDLLDLPGSYTLNGRSPDERIVGEALRNQLDENFPVKPTNHINPEVPIALSQLILRCLAHSPDQRYPNMTILNAQLHTILGVQQVPVTLEAKAQTITVKPLPTANKPSSFNGAVGRYTMQAKASPLEVTVGDPVTVSIQISGQGAIESLNLPKLDWAGFKSYEPSVTTKKDNSLGLLGTRTFEQVVIPERDTIAEVPRIEFPYFDPVTGRYRVLAKGPFPLKVNPGDKPVAPTVAAGSAPETKEPESPPQTDILTIKHHLGSLGQATPLVARPGYWLLQSIPLLLWLAALAWRRKTNTLANNPRLRRQRQVAERTHAGLAKLNDLAKRETAGEFHAELADLLREQIGLRLDIPAEGITGDIVHSPAACQQFSETLRDDIRKLFTASDQASYAGSQTTGEMKAHLALLKELIRALK